MIKGEIKTDKYNLEYNLSTIQKEREEFVREYLQLFMESFIEYGTTDYDSWQGHSYPNRGTASLRDLIYKPGDAIHKVSKKFKNNPIKVQVNDANSRIHINNDIKTNATIEELNFGDCVLLDFEFPIPQKNEITPYNLGMTWWDFFKDFNEQYMMKKTIFNNFDSYLRIIPISSESIDIYSENGLLKADIDVIIESKIKRNKKSKNFFEKYRSQKEDSAGIILKKLTELARLNMQVSNGPLGSAVAFQYLTPRHELTRIMITRLNDDSDKTIFQEWDKWEFQGLWHKLFTDFEAYKNILAEQHLQQRAREENEKLRTKVKKSKTRIRRVKIKQIK